MKDFSLPFNLEPCKQLDRFALLAEQTYNLGNRGDWFGYFRGGLHGFYSRIYGVVRHYEEIHRWAPRPTMPEYHLASIFFNMDSALECFVFLMNALGNSVAPDQFLDITDAQALRQVAPSNILGKGEQPPLAGYGQYFPSLQTHWQTHGELLQTVVEQHDVSKHREMIYFGGRLRRDAPAGFYEALGITDNQTAQVLFWPMEETSLDPDPKKPRAKRTPKSHQELTLEGVAEDFSRFVDSTLVHALGDATTNIDLAHNDFVRP